MKEKAAPQLDGWGRRLDAADDYDPNLSGLELHKLHDQIGFDYSLLTALLYWFDRRS